MAECASRMECIIRVVGHRESHSSGVWGEGGGVGEQAVC